MGMKNAVNVPVDVDPETGEYNLAPLVERIKRDQQPVGKTKVSAPRTWSYKAPETDLEREENMLAFERVLDLSQMNETERKGWNVVLSSDDKDYLWSVWKLFILQDDVLPLVRSDTRCAREMIRMLGFTKFPFMAKKGHEWTNLSQNDRTRDDEIQKWIEEFTSQHLASDPSKGFTCTLMVRFVCARAVHYMDNN